MDWNPDFRKIGMEGLVLLVNGADDARAAVRKLVSGPWKSANWPLSSSLAAMSWPTSRCWKPARVSSA